MPPIQMSTDQMSTKFLLSLSTAPLLFLLIGNKILVQMMQDMGQMSEEVFRGDRLPILHMSPHREEG